MAAEARVLIVDADPALAGLVEQWLDDHGCSVTRHAGSGALPDADLVIVDVPFPREGGSGMVRRLATELAGVPVLALSSNFFAGIEANGAVARWLGVSATLPKPLSQDLLLSTVRKLLPTHV